MMEKMKMGMEEAKAELVGTKEEMKDNKTDKIRKGRN